MFFLQNFFEFFFLLQVSIIKPKARLSPLALSIRPELAGIATILTNFVDSSIIDEMRSSLTFGARNLFEHLVLEHSLSLGVIVFQPIFSAKHRSILYTKCILHMMTLTIRGITCATMETTLYGVEEFANFSIFKHDRNLALCCKFDKFRQFYLSWWDVLFVNSPREKSLPALRARAFCESGSGLGQHEATRERWLKLPCILLSCLYWLFSPQSNK